MANITVVIPTHNRSNLLNRAIQSIQSIFDDATVIIGDNSNIQYQAENQHIADQYRNCKYLDLSQYEANLPKVYKCMLSAATTEYVLPLDDDDVLVNKKTHSLALKIIAQKKCLVSFNTIEIESHASLLNANRFVEITDIDKLPLFWNGQFQTGAMYYNRKDLLMAIDKWQTSSNVFDLSHDECWAMLCMAQCRKCCHIPAVGLQVQRCFSGSMARHLALFSSRDYIDKMADMLSLSYETRQKWKTIQIRELKQICQNENLKYNDVFENKNAFIIDDFISTHCQDMDYNSLKASIIRMLKDIYDI